MADAEFSYKPGTIRRLKLINFMCHESFELEFGPRVNFVIGPNGSGKSALLTGLVVVLGGRATTTSRAKRASDFVQYGKKYAKIICELHNYDKIMDKEQAFKPDEYGKRIVIEKIIYKDEQGGSKLTLKNDKEKRISERKQELDEMLEHFGILINNPICILNQEVSKTFLHSKKPEDKFELFMKATNLEQIENDYCDAMTAHVEWKGVNSRKEFGFKLLDNEYQNCREKSNFLVHRLKLEETLIDLTKEFLWAVFRDHEEEAKSVEASIGKVKDKICASEADIDKLKENISAAEVKIESHRVKAQSCLEDSEKSKKKVADLADKYAKIRTKRLDIQHAIEGGQRKLSRLERDKERLEKSIDDIRQKMNENSSARDNERRKLEIQQLEREIESEKARELSLRQHTDQLNKSMSEVRVELSKATMRITELSNNSSVKSASLKRLIGGQENEIRKYGDYMLRICEEVEQAHKQGKFKEKPRGPLGYYIKLKSPDVAQALEVHLGKNAHAFTCDNIQDMATLNTIIRKVRTSSLETNFRDPLILTRKFTEKHNVSRFKALHDKYKTMLDYIDIDESSVYNAIVDRTALEQVLFIPDYTEAQNLMITQSSIPRGTRCAYTKDCHVMYPRTARGGFRCMANGRSGLCLFSKGNEAQVKDARRELTIIEGEIRDAEANRARIQDSYNAQRSEYDNNIIELRKIQKEISTRETKVLDLKTTVTEIQPEELSANETELDTCLSQIHETKKNIEFETTKLAEIDNELKDVAGERESATNVFKQKEQERQKVHSDITHQKDVIKKYNETIAQLRITLTSLGREEAQLTKKLDEVNLAINQARKKLNDDRPGTLRPTEEVRREKGKVEAQLKVEIAENEDPEKLMETLKKRMAEIEGIVALKNHNESNYNLSTTTLKDRQEGFKILRHTTCGSVSTTFASVMRAMGMMGLLTIYLEDKLINGQLIAKAKTLEMSIDTSPSQRPGALGMNDNNTETPIQDRRGTRSQPNPQDGGPRSKRARLTISPSEKENQKMTDTRSLSGGERSFSTVAFVLALWHHCSSPFKLMDEIDVFMDMVTRRLSYNALIKFAEITENPGQFIFFSPLELPRIDSAENLVRVFEMPRIIRKGALSQPPTDNAVDQMDVQT